MLKLHQMLIFILISAQMYGLLSDVPEECDEVQKPYYLKILQRDKCQTSLNFIKIFDAS